MMMVVLFGLLDWFLAGFREGVWTQYTPQDVARWRPRRLRPPTWRRWSALRQRRGSSAHETRRPRARTIGPAQANTGRKKLRS